MTSESRHREIPRSDTDEPTETQTPPWFDDRGRTGLSSTATESFKKTWYTPAVSLVVRRGFTLQYCTGSILDAEYSH